MKITGVAKLKYKGKGHSTVTGRTRLENCIHNHENKNLCGWSTEGGGDRNCCYCDQSPFSVQAFGLSTCVNSPGYCWRKGLKGPCTPFPAFSAGQTGCFTHVRRFLHVLRIGVLKQTVMPACTLPILPRLLIAAFAIYPATSFLMLLFFLFVYYFFSVVSL